MALITNKLAAATAVAAAFSMLAAPAAAIDLPHRAAGVYDADAGNVNQHRHRRWRDRDNGVDVGDVITGVLVLGGIAAILGAGRDRGERYRYPEDAGYRGPSSQPRFESRGMDRAVDLCVSEVEDNGERVRSVDSAARDAELWHVAGELEDGAPYACWIDDDGLLVDVQIGGDRSEAAPVDGQWSDDAYARARARHEAGSIGG